MEIDGHIRRQLSTAACRHGDDCHINAGGQPDRAPSPARRHACAGHLVAAAVILYPAGAGGQWRASCGRSEIRCQQSASPLAAGSPSAGRRQAGGLEEAATSRGAGGAGGDNYWVLASAPTPPLRTRNRKGKAVAFHCESAAPDVEFIGSVSRDGPA
jgi:hypothetical protein